MVKATAKLAECSIAIFGGSLWMLPVSIYKGVRRVAALVIYMARTRKRQAAMMAKAEA